MDAVDARQTHAHLLGAWRAGDLALAKRGTKGFSLQSDGNYREIEMSLNLPMLRVKELEPFLDPKLAADESQWILAFHPWVRERFGD
ncbi:MAG TPA: hypothetical protein VNH11_28610 [Pirellulales bacterium]|nr:hypothetical protein [Pirellulales bacterium]